MTVSCSVKHMVGVEDINSSRNGLLLFRPIEWSFNTSRAIFIRDELGNWVYTLLDQGLHDVQLIDIFIELEKGTKNMEVSNWVWMLLFHMTASAKGMRVVVGRILALHVGGNPAWSQNIW